MANLTITKDKSKFEVAKSALKKVMQAKRVYQPEVIDEREDCISVMCLDQFDNMYETFISLSDLEDFITNFYSNVVDDERGGDHYQYIDCRTAIEYYRDNQAAVIKDFLNNAKWGAVK